MTILYLEALAAIAASIAILTAGRWTGLAGVGGVALAGGVDSAGPRRAGQGAGRMTPVIVSCHQRFPPQSKGVIT
jgi:hypothetical protein